ncbi:uncharacterized protein LOC143033331 [Oratosquilla oratoria]|uniref:uncharacterized protein LOC143033331 n=1 Tax=Oratosquilla oratoria TaxID=337810 RepID=UPI003F764F68
MARLLYRQASSRVKLKDLKDYTSGVKMCRSCFHKNHGLNTNNGSEPETMSHGGLEKTDSSDLNISDNQEKSGPYKLISESVDTCSKSGPPEAPSTCCMSGCANCVWIDYADALAKYYKDGGKKAKEAIEKEVTDPNMKAFLTLELSMR